MGCWSFQRVITIRKAELAAEREAIEDAKRSGRPLMVGKYPYEGTYSNHSLWRHWRLEFYEY